MAPTEPEAFPVCPKRHSSTPALQKTAALHRGGEDLPRPAETQEGPELQECPGETRGLRRQQNSANASEQNGRGFREIPAPEQ
jgi:hypothetical protein